MISSITVKTAKVSTRESRHTNLGPPFYPSSSFNLPPLKFVIKDTAGSGRNTEKEHRTWHWHSFRPHSAVSCVPTWACFKMQHQLAHQAILAKLVGQGWGQNLRHHILNRGHSQLYLHLHGKFTSVQGWGKPEGVETSWGCLPLVAWQPFHPNLPNTSPHFLRLGFSPAICLLSNVLKTLWPAR